MRRLFGAPAVRVDIVPLRIRGQLRVHGVRQIDPQVMRYEQCVDDDVRKFFLYAREALRVVLNFGRGLRIPPEEQLL